MEARPERPQATEYLCVWWWWGEAVMRCDERAAVVRGRPTNVWTDVWGRKAHIWFQPSDEKGINQTLSRRVFNAVKGCARVRNTVYTYVAEGDVKPLCPTLGPGIH